LINLVDPTYFRADSFGCFSAFSSTYVTTTVATDFY
jgi:hypothetical protein